MEWGQNICQKYSRQCNRLLSKSCFICLIIIFYFKTMTSKIIYQSSYRPTKPSTIG